MTRVRFRKLPYQSMSAAVSPQFNWSFFLLRYENTAASGETLTFQEARIDGEVWTPLDFQVLHIPKTLLQRCESIRLTGSVSEQWFCLRHKPWNKTSRNKCGCSTFRHRTISTSNGCSSNIFWITSSNLYSGCVCKGYYADSGYNHSKWLLALENLSGKLVGPRISYSILRGYDHVSYKITIEDVINMFSDKITVDIINSDMLHL